jgi:molecular chaperone GrpE
VTEPLSEHEGSGQEDGEHRGPTVRDRRRIDPETYQVREPQETAAPGPTPAELADNLGASEVTELKTALAERTGDLQRLQAEYINYKRRVDRDRDLVRRAGIEGVLKDLLSVLDDLRSAREHGELTGAFKAVGDEVERITTKHGLTSFGSKGDAFDPHIHEALLHAHAEGIDGPTCVEILQPGYRVGDRILRPARVAVAEPEPDIAPEPVMRPEPIDELRTGSVEGLAEGLRQAQPADSEPAEEQESVEQER